MSDDYKKAAFYIVQRHLIKLKNDGKIVQCNDKWKVKLLSNL